MSPVIPRLLREKASPGGSGPGTGDQPGTLSPRYQPRRAERGQTEGVRIGMRGAGHRSGVHGRPRCQAGKQGLVQSTLGGQGLGRLFLGTGLWGNPKGGAWRGTGEAGHPWESGEAWAD